MTTAEYISIERGATSARLYGCSRLEAYEGGCQVAEWTESPDFGHAGEVEDFIRGYRESRGVFYSPDELVVTSLMTFAARESLTTGEPVRVGNGSSLMTSLPTKDLFGPAETPAFAPRATGRQAHCR